MSGHDVELIPKKTERDAHLCDVLLLQASDVLNSGPCVVRVDRLRLR